MQEDINFQNLLKEKDKNKMYKWKNWEKEKKDLERLCENYDRYHLSHKIEWFAQMAGCIALLGAGVLKLSNSKTLK